MSFMSFAVGSLSGAFLVSQVALKMDEYSKVYDARLYSQARRPAYKRRDFDIETYLHNDSFTEHPTFTEFRNKWNSSVWKVRDQVLSLVNAGDDSKPKGE